MIGAARLGARSRPDFERPLDAEAAILVAIVGLIAAGQLLDTLTTIISIGRGGNEANPLAAAVMGHFGMAGFIACKAAVTIFIASIISTMRGLTLALASGFVVLFTFCPVGVNLVAIAGLSH